MFNQCKYYSSSWSFYWGTFWSSTFTISEDSKPFCITCQVATQQNVTLFNTKRNTKAQTQYLFLLYDILQYAAYYVHSYDDYCIVLFYSFLVFNEKCNASLHKPLNYFLDRAEYNLKRRQPWVSTLALIHPPATTHMNVLTYAFSWHFLIVYQCILLDWSSWLEWLRRFDFKLWQW